MAVAVAVAVAGKQSAALFPARVVCNVYANQPNFSRFTADLIENFKDSVACNQI